jgi:hypothetical protein
LIWRSRSGLPDRVIKRRLRLLRWLRVLDRDGRHQDAGAVASSIPACGCAPRRDFLARLVQDRVHRLAPDHFSHRRLGRLDHRGRRVATPEQIVLRPGVLDPVLHLELDVDDVFVVRQHQCLFQALRAAARPNLDAPHGQDVDQFARLDRPWQAPAESRRRCFGIAAERRHNANLPLGHDVEAAANPDQRNDGDDRRESEAGALAVRPQAAETPAVAAAPTAATAAEEVVQSTIEIAPEPDGRALAADAGLALFALNVRATRTASASHWDRWATSF